eukprot:scaffold426_cov219-Amphora_coffeaeformis.AAC.4
MSTPASFLARSSPFLLYRGGENCRTTFPAEGCNSYIILLYMQNYGAGAGAGADDLPLVCNEISRFAKSSPRDRCLIESHHLYELLPYTPSRLVDGGRR